MRLDHACYLTKFRKKINLIKYLTNSHTVTLETITFFLILMYDHFFIYLQIVAI
jgi:hypothetical protein